MIKTETITIPATKAHTEEIEVRICDFCGHKSRGSRAVNTCMICKRHACNGLAKGCVRFDHDGSDYPDTYCPICYSLRFTKYRKVIDDIKEEADNQVEVVIQIIKQESLKQQAKNDKASKD